MARGRASEKSADGRTSNGSTSVAVRAKAIALLDRIAEEGEVTPARLAELTGEPRSTIYRLLASLQELDLVEPGRRRGTYLLALSLGGSLPLHVGGAPRTLLAFEPPDQWDAYLEHREPEALTPKTPATRKALIEELRATRERGYAISDEDVTPGVAAVGAPILDHTGAVRAALSIGGMRDAVLGPSSRAVELVCDGAAEISRTLGHDGTRPPA